MTKPPNPWIPHIEAFVSSTSASNQAAGAIASLVKNGALTLDTLVKDMELYLTATDNFVRDKGVTLLAEVVVRLSLKRLDSATVHSLTEFFASRLADWQALHGALLGCWTLLRRKSDVGMVVGSDARSVAESFLQNLQVQLLAQHDRKLCFGILESLLDCYAEDVMILDKTLVDGICDAIDNEKDPSCLMVMFHIVESLVKIFSDPCGPVASIAEDLFEILSCYFPIYFTHPKTDTCDITRDDLSLALMRVFSSTSLFEPYAIPLLLEKLSSSLPLAKIDSLKYLGSCMSYYGASRMAKHSKPIWHFLKEVIFSFPAQESFFLIEDSLKGGGSHSHDNEICREALTCLRAALSQININDTLFVSWIIEDEEFDLKFTSVADFPSYESLSVENKQILGAVGSVLGVCTNVSHQCCDRIFHCFFPRVLDMLGISSSNSSVTHKTCGNLPTKVLNFGALYLSVELLASCRDLAATSEEQVLGEHRWFSLLQDVYVPLTSSLGLLATTSGSGAADVHYAVKGLQILATFPERLQLCNAAYKDILTIFMSIITTRSGVPMLWKLALESLIQIGAFVESTNQSEKRLIYISSVVEYIISLIYLEDSKMSFALKVEALFAVGASSPAYMSRVIEELEKLIFASLVEVLVKGTQNYAATLVCLLDCYSRHVLPWCNKSGHFEEIALPFALRIWSQMENLDVPDISFEQDVLDAMIMAMKAVVGNCKEENQFIVIQKAYRVIQFNICLSRRNALGSMPWKIDSALDLDSITLSRKDELLVSLFAAVLIALHPNVVLPDIKTLLRWLMIFLLKGLSLAGQAVGSIFNKWPISIKVDEAIGTSCTLDEALIIVFEMGLTASDIDFLQQNNKLNMNIQSLRDSYLLQKNAARTDVIAGLAWIGKGLLMSGHEKVKEITMLLLKYLLPDRYIEIDPSHGSTSINDNGQIQSSLLANSAADAFNIFLCDSEICLNKNFNATVKPLYKQRFFSSVTPLLLSSIKESDSSSGARKALYRALGHVISNTPQAALITEMKKLILPLLEGLSVLSADVSNRDLVYGLLLVFSGMLTDLDGKDIVIENAHIIIDCLLKLALYPHKMLVRKTSIQCIIAVSDLPYPRIYPMRQKVLQTMSKACDDLKRPVRVEAVRCKRAWGSIA